jgi:hypothetical protein
MCDLNWKSEANLIFVLRIEDGGEGGSQIYPEGLQEQCEQLDEVIQIMVC